MFHRQYDFNQTRQPGSLQGMSDVGFHAANRNLMAGGNILTHE